MTLGERATAAVRWIAERKPRTILYAGWIAFAFGSYPGYMSTDSILQLYSVRSGDYTDYSPVMTGLWGMLEYVSAGPAPMLALQSGLFLFGLYAILRKLISPRAAAVTAALVLIFPPVFSTMAVIWPDPLMAGALLAGFGALLDERRNWRLAGIVLLGIAMACRPEVSFAVIPLVLAIVPPSKWWRRAGIAIGVVVGLFVASHIADRVLIEKDTYNWQQRLMVMDVVGTLRRAKIKGDKKLHTAVAGIPLAAGAGSAFEERMTASNDLLNWAPMSNGEKRVFELITDDDQSAALSHVWRHTIIAHPGAYVRHRWALMKAQLGLGGKWAPVYDSFGDSELMAPLHHRATTSDWQYTMQAIVRGVAATPLFSPWLYVLLAIAAIVLARKRPIPRALAISGLVYELTLFVLAPNVDYRYSHWLVAATCAALAAVAVARKWPADANG